MRLRTASRTLARPFACILSLSAAMMLMTSDALPSVATSIWGARCSTLARSNSRKASAYLSEIFLGSKGPLSASINSFAKPIASSFGSTLMPSK